MLSLLKLTLSVSLGSMAVRLQKEHLMESTAKKIFSMISFFFSIFYDYGNRSDNVKIGFKDLSAERILIFNDMKS